MRDNIIELTPVCIDDSLKSGVIRFKFRRYSDGLSYVEALQTTFPGIVDSNEWLITGEWCISKGDFDLLRLSYIARYPQKQTEQFLIKSMRGDQENFFDAFKDMITRSPLQQTKFPLRKGPKKLFTTKGTGVEERATRQPQYSLEQKKFLSQPQSTTLAISGIHPIPFKFKSDPTNSQVVFIFDTKDMLPNRFYLYDGGTINRPYDFNSRAEAEQYFKKKVQDQQCLFATLDELIKAMRGNEANNRYSEVLARIKWNTDGTSKIGVHPDKEAITGRWLAQGYAKSLHQRLLAQQREFIPADYEERKGDVDDFINIPLCYYAPDRPEHMNCYTPFDQGIDQMEAERLFLSDLKQEYYKKNKFEFLLVLDEANLIAELKTTPCDNLPLLLFIIKCGYVHIASLLVDILGMQLFEDLINDRQLRHEHLIKNEIIRTGHRGFTNAFIKNQHTYFSIDHVITAMARENWQIAKAIDKRACYTASAAQEFQRSDIFSLLSTKNIGHETPIQASIRLKHWDLIKSIVFCEQYRIHYQPEYRHILAEAVKAEEISVIDILLDRQISKSLTPDEFTQCVTLAIKKGPSALSQLLELRPVEAFDILVNLNQWDLIPPDLINREIIPKLLKKISRENPKEFTQLVILLIKRQHPAIFELLDSDPVITQDIIVKNWPRRQYDLSRGYFIQVKKEPSCASSDESSESFDFRSYFIMIQEILFKAIQNQDLTVIQLFANQHSLLNSGLFYGENFIIHHLIETNNEAILTICLPIDITMKTREGLTPIELAVKHGAFGIVTMILTQPNIDLQTQMKEYTQLFFSAIRNNHVALVRYLLDIKIRLNFPAPNTEAVRSVLSLAIAKANYPVWALLLKYSDPLELTEMASVLFHSGNIRMTPEKHHSFLPLLKEIAQLSQRKGMLAKPELRRFLITTTFHSYRHYLLHHSYRHYLLQNDGNNNPDILIKELLFNLTQLQESFAQERRQEQAALCSVFFESKKISQMEVLISDCVKRYKTPAEPENANAAYAAKS